MKPRTGSIYPEKDRKGVYTGRWIRETTVDGGKRLRSKHASLEQAQLAGSAAQGHLEAIPQGATLKDIPETLWRGTKDELQSQQRWRLCVSLLGPGLSLARIRKPELEALARSLAKDGRGPKTINRYLATVSRALRWAAESDLITGLPPIPWQKEPQGRLVFIPENRIEVFLDALSRDYGEPCALAADILLLTGMRVGELLGVTSRDIHADAVHLSQTKTGRPRAIPLPSNYGPMVLSWLPYKPTYRTLLEAIKKAGLSIGIPDLTPHALRHTAATRLIARGVPSLTVAELLGHSSLATTRQYTHHNVDTLRQAVASLLLPTRGAKDGSQVPSREQPKEKQEPAWSPSEGKPPNPICSPLRSHSATRPKDS